MESSKNISFLKIGILLAGVLMSCLFLFPQKVQAETLPYVNINPSTDATWDAYIDAENYVCIETYDLEHTSTITYMTLGFTVTRCSLNQKQMYSGTTSPYVSIPIFREQCDIVDERVRLSNNKVYLHNRFRIPLHDILAVVRSNGFDEWANEIYECYYNGGKDICYLKLDGIMTTVVNGRMEGYIRPDGSDFIGKLYHNRPFDNDSEIRALENAYGWRDPSQIKTHFNRYLGPYGADAAGAGTGAVPVPEAVSLYETKNTSAEYDISEAIPSGEQVTNTISAASFTGNNLTVGEKQANKGYGVTFNCTMHYTVPRWVPEKTEDLGTFDDDPGFTDSGLDSYSVTPRQTIIGGALVTVYDVTKTTAAHWEYDDYYEHQTVVMSMTAKLAYQYIAACPQLYEFDSMTVFNNHFPEGSTGQRSIFYDRSSVNVPDVKATFRIYSKQAESLGGNYIQLSQHMASANPATYDYTPMGSGYHYEFLSSNNLSFNVSIEGDHAGDWSNLRGAVQDKANEAAAQISNGTWSCNDYAMINDGITIYNLMSDTKVYGADVEGSVTVMVNGSNLGTVSVDTNTNTAAYSAFRHGGQGDTIDNINDRLRASRATAKQTVTIPGDADNVDYPTGCSVTYKNLLLASDNTDTISMYAGKNFFSGASVDSIYDHVMRDGRGGRHDGGDPADGYPIRVHTPVITPVRIVDPDGNEVKESTQLVSSKYNSSAEHQLLLDESYFIKWDNDLWTSSLWGETPEGYTDILDKYVDSKWMRFPFDVVYNDTIYERDDFTGFTEWIEVEAPAYYDDAWDSGVDPYNYESANHWQMTPFYIPSFAQEGGTPGNDVYVEVKVQARNVLGRDLGNHESCIQMLQNSSTDNYVASARRNVQMSGWLYDFTIVGTENGMIYNGQGLLDDDTQRGYDPLAFCETKTEKKANAFNRFGNNVYRYLSDGTLTNSIDLINLLPIQNGSSYSFRKMGDVWRGQDFAFTVKTIANLDGPNDSIEITPSFTYITEDGEILSTEKGEIMIYTPEKSGLWEPPVESITYNKDNTDVTGGEEVFLADELFDESYYDTGDSNYFQFGDWVTESVENENTDMGYAGWQLVDKQEYMYRKTPSYTFSHISIPATLRYISGEYEQLKCNENNQYVRGGNSNLKDYKSLDGYNAGVEKKFIYSMQQWQSKYVVPSSTKIVDVRNHGGTNFNLIDRMNELDFWDWDKDPIVFPEKGRLVINFDIVAYKDGEPYLRYAGGNAAGTDMWEREHFNENDPANPSNPENPDTPIKEGDVVIVDFDKSVEDYWEAAIFNIN